MTALLRWRTAALYAIAALVAAGSLAAFAESYRGLYDWSREHGLSGFWAAAWPLQLDVFIAIGELALFVALVDAWPKRARVAAWAVTITGAAVSVAGNVGHVQSHDIASRLSAGVPPVAAACALFVALGVLKHVTAAARSAPAILPAEGQRASVLPPAAEPVTLPQSAPEPVPVIASPAALKPAGRAKVTVPKRTRGTPKTAAEAEAVFAPELAAGSLPSLRKIKAECHVGDDAAGEIMAHLRSVLEGRMTMAGNGNGAHP